MRHGNEFLGLQVKLSGTDQVIGRIEDVIVSRTRKSVIGLLLRHANWLHKAKFIPCCEIQSISSDAVVILDEQSVEMLESTPDGIRVSDHNEFFETPLLSTNGHEFGRIVDVCFNELTGELDGFVVLTGVAPGATSGPVFLPLDEDISVRKDAVIVGDRATDRLMFEATEIGRRDFTKGHRPLPESPSIDGNSVDPDIAGESVHDDHQSTLRQQIDEKMQILVSSISGLWHGFDRA